MEHHFNLKIASKFGVDGAIFIHNLHYWIVKNKANGKHFYEDNYWTYNSIEALCVLFPYWSKRQIERIINNLVESGAILKGNFNQSKYDRTSWYALTQMVKSIYANGEMDFTEHVLPFTQTVEPIPNSNTNNKTTNSKPTNLLLEKEAKDIAETKILEAIEVLEFLNQVAETGYKKVDSNLKFINARLKDGFTVQDLKKIITAKTLEWKNDPKMSKYLRPETLFNTTKCQGYHQQVLTIEKNPQKFINHVTEKDRAEQRRTYDPLDYMDKDGNYI